MNLEYFIARRVQHSTEYKNSVSAPIIKIATAAIAIGMIVMIIAVATGVGLQKKIREKVSAFNGDITISLFDRNNSITTVKPISINQDFYPDFSSVSQVSHVQAVATKGAMIRTATDFEGVILKGVGTDYRWDSFNDFLIEGALPDVSQEATSKDILISDDIARRLQLKVGDKAPTYFMKENEEPLARAFNVIGIYDSGLAEYDTKFILGDIRNIQKINKWNEDEIGKFEVFIDDFENIDEIGKDVFLKVPQMLDARTIKDQYPTIFQWLALLDSNVYGIIAIILIVGIINMITALLVLILDRTGMIGLLKSLGASDWTVRKIFLYNAMSLILKGLFWGNLIGLGLVALQYFFAPLTLDPSTYYVTEAPVYISWWHVLLLNLGTFLICLLVLIIPTYIVSRISPVKAMRFE
ncbi:lipoprotein-releasing system permease protein [Nonlabens sp. Hel1_33_55]|uniref:ABC transporter permease n=1 Tax=Nonlabens sp. Hel1_33_55 TaxID=1336802 RepID=UPI000875BE95|nr:FtsX-like permease family protein [Nonlabens sp. Hel1_33_55]SCY44986.1 lipoprotein-releasing system permease protein [Nonlabens sp. Hel1_33_55]